MINGGRFDFDDGGTYCGGWEDGKAHGHGVCTGPKGQGEYSGAWHYGFEVSGVYAWPSGNSYLGQWQNGKRHGLGVERRGRWIYRGEWTQGYKGRYGVRQSINSQARYEGTWANGLQDGYGTETYADGGTYQGQWLRGMRHGYGARRSAQYSVAAKYRSRSHAHASLTSLRSDQGDDVTTHTSSDGKEKKTDDSRGGFVLRARSEAPGRRRSLSERSVAVKRSLLQGLRIKKQRSTGDISQRIGSGTGSIRSSGSTGSCASDESAMTGCSGHDHGSFIGVEEFVDPSAVETYMGEWKNDKRSGFGVSERSDGLKYEGEWFNNKKNGYGITTLKDGTKEEGKYKGNILITSQRKKNLLFVRSSKLRERIDAAVSSANRAAQIAVQKSEIAVSRATASRDRGDQADLAGLQAKEDSDLARLCAKQFAPEFHQPGIDLLKKRQREEQQIGNHVTSAMKTGVGSGELSQSIDALPPKGGYSAANYVGGENENYQITGSAQTTPMFTPLEEHAAIDQAHRRQQLTLGRLQQHSFESDGGQPPPQGALMQNDSSLIPGGGGGRDHSENQQHPFNIYQAGRQQQLLRQKEAAALGQRVNNAAAAPFGGSSFSPHTSTVGGQGLPPSHYQRSIHQPTGIGAAGPSSGADAGGGSPAISRTPSQSSSRYSLNQIINDHFDQYTMAANPSAAKLLQANLSRQQDSPAHRTNTSSADGNHPMSAVLTRRSTLASSRDWRGLLSSTFDAVPERTVGGALTTESNAATANRGDTTTTNVPHQNRVATTHFGAEDSDAVRRRPTTTASHLFGAASENRGSLPDVSELDKNPIRLMPREEVARMSSQRRQELQRMQEEAELLRSNPFRYLRYLYHPSVRAWVIRWKLPLLVLLVNIALSFGFYRLLTYSSDGKNREDTGHRS